MDKKKYACDGKEITVMLGTRSFTVRLECKKYPPIYRCSKSQIAIIGFDPDDDIFGTLTVNLPENYSCLNEDEVFIKTWSENEPFAEAALASGFFIDTGKRVTTGFCKASIWKLLTEEEWQKETGVKEKRCYSDWVCSECEDSKPAIGITFEELALSGIPICLECGEEMTLSKEYYQ